MASVFFETKYLGHCEYLPLLTSMQDFTQNRTIQTQDQIWILEHLPVYTLGQNATHSDVIQPTHIPVVQSDRGGQITYHGPGQLVIYTLLDLRRLNCNLRHLVTALETTVIQVLSCYDVHAYSRKEAPGVYVHNQKIASVGLRIRKGCAYHGMALNIRMDLEPFQNINPCGFKNLKVTQLVEWVTTSDLSLNTISQQFLKYFLMQPFYHT